MPEIYGRTVEAKAGDYLQPELWAFGNRLVPSWWDKAQFYLPTNSGGPIKELAVNVVVTGRTLQRRQGDLFVRCRVEFVGDGEPSQYTGGWLKVE